MTNDSKIRQWLLSNGVYNAIVKVNGQFFKVNATLGIQLASEQDAQGFPTIEPPDWLEIMCQEYVEDDRANG